MESFNMKPLNQSYPATICLGTFALFFLLYRILRKRCTSGTTRTAPEPSGAWPLLGHLPLLFEPSIAHITLGALADKYGPAFTMRLGLHKALVINSWEVAKECYTTNDRVFATRPSTVAARIMGYNNAIVSFAPYGPYWREMRKIITLELLSNKRLELLKHVRISEVNMSIRELYETWQVSGEKRSDGYSLVDMKEWFGDFNLNLILRMVAGKRYSGTKSDSEGNRLQKAVSDYFHLVGLFVLSDAVPFFGWLDFQGHEKAMKRTADELDWVMEKWLQEHKQKKLKSGVKDEEDFMDVMLSVLEDNKITDFDSDVINKATCMNMIFGGADTIPVTMIWALSLLLNNGHILKKIQDELDTVVGKDRHVDVLDLEKLVYFHATVKEVLRLYPAAPLSGVREAMEDCTIGGYHVAAGTRLITNVWKIQRDPRMWSNPSEFQPERFLTTHAEVDNKGKHFQYIPFGSGRRGCPAISFALQVLHLGLARLLQSFDFKTPSNEAVDMTESAGLTNMKATPLQVLITPRLSPHLY